MSAKPPLMCYVCMQEIGHGFDAYVVLPGYEKDERIRYYHLDCFKNPKKLKKPLNKIIEADLQELIDSGEKGPGTYAINKGISLDQVEIDRGNAQNNSVTCKKAPASDDEDRLV